jgi:hypothetical protein
MVPQSNNHSPNLEIRMKFAMLVLAAGLFTQPVFAAESAKKEAKEAVNAVKETASDADEKVCETVNGKVKCVGKKIKNAGKKVGHKVDEATTK